MFRKRRAFPARPTDQTRRADLARCDCAVCILVGWAHRWPGSETPGMAGIYRVLQLRCPKCRPPLGVAVFGIIAAGSEIHCVSEGWPATHCEMSISLYLDSVDADGEVLSAIRIACSEFAPDDRWVELD